MKTTLLGRNIRSRKWNVCRFSIHDISGGKADTASDPGQDIYLRNCHFVLFFLLLLVIFSLISRWGITSASWEYAFNGISTAPSRVPTIPTGKRPWNAEMPTFRKREIQEQWAPAWRPNCELFLSCLHVLSPHTDAQKLCYSLEQVGYTAPLLPTPCRADADASPRAKGPKTGSNSHQGTQAALVLKPGLTLESPGVKTTQMLPPRSTDSVGGHRWGYC